MAGGPARLHHLGGQGADLVLIHGFGSDRFSWAATAPAFFATHRVWAVELPGHGDADNAVGTGDPAALAEAAAECLADLARPFAVVGHSMGGAVALHLAALLPGAISDATLIAPAGFGRLDGGFLRAFPRLETPEETEALLRRLVVRERLISPAMAGHVLAMLERPGRREALSRIAEALLVAPPPPVPEGLAVTVVWGAADGINAPDAELASRFGEHFALLADVGHMPHVEAATKVNRLIAGGVPASRA